MLSERTKVDVRSSARALGIMGRAAGPICEGVVMSGTEGWEVGQYRTVRGVVPIKAAFRARKARYYLPPHVVGATP